MGQEGPDGRERRERGRRVVAVLPFQRLPPIVPSAKCNMQVFLLRVFVFFVATLCSRFFFFVFSCFRG
jgi:hypothetical protein